MKSLSLPKAPATLVSIAICISAAASLPAAADVNDFPNATGAGVEIDNPGAKDDHWLGAYVNPDGSAIPAWCIELGPTAPSDLVGSTVGVIDGEPQENGQDASVRLNAEQMAYLLSKYQDENGTSSRAALSTLVHVNFDITGPAKIASFSADVIKQHPEIWSLAQQYASEARSNVIGDYADPTITGDSEMSGTVGNLGAKNRDGSWIAGRSVSVTLEGPAVFKASGTNTWSGATADKPLELEWESTGAGEVSVKVTYDKITPKTLTVYRNDTKNQDLALIGATPSDVVRPAKFRTTHDFQPKVVSSTDKADSRMVAEGATSIKDQIEVSADETYAGGAKWAEVDGSPVPITVKGTAYYTGHQPVSSSQEVPEGAEAIGSTTVTANGPGTYTAQLDVPAGLRAEFITWVWTISKADQGDNARYVHADYSDAYGLDAEYTSVQEGPVEVASTIGSNVTKDGHYLVDNIYIAGFDDDHGKFEGGSGFGADNKSMQQTLYFFPEGLEVSDANKDQATKIATVDVPAVNGYVNAVGSKDFKVLDGNPPGTYVFVTSFEGDDRTLPFTSSVTDPHEQMTVPRTPPELHTTATDKADGDKVLPTFGDVTVSDRVCQVDGKGLELGKTYELTATAMDKETGSALLDGEGKPYTGKASFTPTSGSDCATVDVTIPASALRGKTIVMFENLTLDGRTVAVHTDINDEGQTVRAPKPEITSSLTDVADGDREVSPGPVRLDDKVCSKNDDTFIAGHTYKVRGTLMDKETGKPVVSGGKPVASEASFTPKKTSDCADVSFEFDTSDLAGHDVVAFEEVYGPDNESELLAEHKDINDKDQTVHVQSKPGTVLAKTGAAVGAFVLTALSLGAAGVGVVKLGRRGKKAQDMAS